MRHVTTAQATEAMRVLDLDMPVHRDDVKAAFRKLSKECHPDSGSYDPTKWHAIGQARITLEAYLDAVPGPLAPTPQGCRACDGTGRTKRGSLVMHCVMCRGTGAAR